MKPNELDINQWQELLTEFNSGIRKKFATPAVMRIENTPFTSARYAGGMTMYGERYTYFEPRDPSQPANPDGTPYVAWLMVRMDFLRWVTKELKKREARIDNPHRSDCCESWLFEPEAQLKVE